MLSILVDRKSKKSREKAMQYMLKTLREGHSLFLYPEGTRNRTSAPLKEFKDGAFRTAITAQVPIAVQTLLNTKGVNNPNGVHLLPGKVTVVWNEPIETKGMTEADIPALSERVRNIMLENLQTYSS
jgi:1-acyl-sn-glycerol-3-phosphate acyltransferase